MQVTNTGRGTGTGRDNGIGVSIEKAHAQARLGLEWVEASRIATTRNRLGKQE